MESAAASETSDLDLHYLQKRIYRTRINPFKLNGIFECAECNTFAICLKILPIEMPA